MDGVESSGSSYAVDGLRAFADDVGDPGVVVVVSSLCTRLQYLFQQC